MSALDLRKCFYPYQNRWLFDRSRFKIGLWARQTGKDHTCAAEAVLDCLNKPNNLWIILASGERQAIESLRKAKDWAQALDFAAENYTEHRSSTGSLINSAEISWSNGSRIIALPANPDTARGYSANLILTEFAFHENPAEIWRAIYPTISNPLRGGKKSLRIISTPNGPGNKFHQLWTTPNPAYSKHFVNIHNAVAQGLPLDIPELRRGLNDPEAWTQEYECQFLDTATILLPYDLIGSCEHPEASLTRSSHPKRGQLLLGIDFGRKHDLTVACLLERLGDVLWMRELLILQQMSTPDQVAHLRPRLKIADLASLDYTGPGIGLGDCLVREFGEFNLEKSRLGKIELCTFTSPFKTELLARLRLAFEERRLRIPSHIELREDLHSLQRVTSISGQISYRAPRTEHGHGDRATALALALRAANLRAPRRCAYTIPYRDPRTLARKRTVILRRHPQPFSR